MPYRVQWSDVAKQQLHDLPSTQFMAVRKMVGSFAYDRWLKGRPFGRGAFDLPNLMMFDLEGLALIYRLDEANQTVEVYTILGGE